ncbi:MAG: hypothetical protein ACT4PK_09370 [Gammaproteobacteria bacterium]
MRAMRWFPVIGALALAAPAFAQDAARTLAFHGYAYDLDSGKFLYTEVHQQRVTGDRWRGGTIDYYAPDGSRIGHKDLDFSADPYVPMYTLQLATGGGYMEAVTAVKPDGIELKKQGYGAKKPETATIEREGAMAADSGFHSFLRDHFAELMAGQTLAFRFVVAGNLDTYKFRARRIEDRDFEGKPSVQLKVEPATWLRLLADPLYILYEPGQRRLLEYRGTSNLHDPKTHKAWTVRIIYPSSRPADAPPLPAGP